MDNFQKRGLRTQFGALCYRVHNSETQVLLVTSRASGRWIIPKGWPMPGETPAAAALTEAHEEGGVDGKSFDVCIGLYSYTKIMESEDDLPCVVSVFPVRVKRLLSTYPEEKQRKRKWFSLKKAAARVREPELKKILKNFDPTYLGL
ncbi:NUDIX hydrolase [Litoreibacter roseus]|uniref:NUDIX hydrolase n=1 Tax=Litoreibacter roseus TaxID=2601869 RepID=A0A6N6JIS6_9RHOB|nr:NUDIX hydrolase [Litoreibacter roseus]GFE65319.1 NUDIX hydrolase [Litoreibacter roseus]